MDPVQAGAGISPLGCIAQLVTALMDLLLPMMGIKSGPVWGAGAAAGAVRGRLLGIARWVLL